MLGVAVYGKQTSPWERSAGRHSPSRWPLVLSRAGTATRKPGPSALLSGRPLGTDRSTPAICRCLSGPEPGPIQRWELLRHSRLLLNSHGHLCALCVFGNQGTPPPAGLCIQNETGFPGRPCGLSNQGFCL